MRVTALDVNDVLVTTDCVPVYDWDNDIIGFKTTYSDCLNTLFVPAGRMSGYIRDNFAYFVDGSKYPFTVIDDDDNVIVKDGIM